MRSFLGVPIVARQRDRRRLLPHRQGRRRGVRRGRPGGSSRCSPRTPRSRSRTRACYERSRELSIVEERNRLARELHDAVTQKLFGARADRRGRRRTVLDRDPDGAGAAARACSELTREAMEELRSLIFELRPPAPESEGLAAALRKHVDVLRRVARRAVAIEPRRATREPRGRARPRSSASPRRRCTTRCATPAPTPRRRAACDCAATAHLRLTVADDGAGFDPDEPGVRSRRLGLTSMEERARALGGTLSIDSAPGAGTTVVLEVPRVIRVLVVDDHAVVRQGLRDVPRAAGRHRGRRRGRRRRGGGRRPSRACSPTSRSSTSSCRAGRRRGDRAPPRRRARDARHRPDELPRRGQGAARRCAPAPSATCSRTSSRRSSSARSAPSTAATRCCTRRSPRGSCARSSRDGAPGTAPNPLTAREREVLGLIARGRAEQGDRLELGVAEKTVKTHVSNILGKLGARPTARRPRSTRCARGSSTPSPEAGPRTNCR